MVVLFLILWLTRRHCRERSPHPSPPHSSRLAPGRCDWLYRHGLFFLLQPTRTGPFKGFPAQLVVLARHVWSRPRHHRQHQVGWSLHHRLGRYLDPTPALAPSRRYQNRHCPPLVQAPLRPCPLSYRHPACVLHGHVRHPLPDPPKPRRW